jgi:hypothetical protein
MARSILIISGQIVVWIILRIILLISKIGFGNNLLLFLIGSNR